MTLNRLEIIVKINFDGLDQNIIAIQAPKENMFHGFWQLVVEQNVGLIGQLRNIQRLTD